MTMAKRIRLSQSRIWAGCHMAANEHSEAAEHVGNMDDNEKHGQHGHARSRAAVLTVGAQQLAGRAGPGRRTSDVRDVAVQPS
ncbi:hypothetical protein E4U41_002886 [Claviceps citrina]|nr:hypothetical protein E4U41_002886 [Claviceps citrina]